MWKKWNKIQESKILRQDKDHVKCRLCNYTCKNDALLKKHIRTKHQEYNCKVCDMKADNSMELIKHTPKEHSKQVYQTRDIESHNHLKKYEGKWSQQKTLVMGSLGVPNVKDLCQTMIVLISMWDSIKRRHANIAPSSSMIRSSGLILL